LGATGVKAVRKYVGEIEPRIGEHHETTKIYGSYCTESKKKKHTIQIYNDAMMKTHA